MASCLFKWSFKGRRSMSVPSWRKKSHTPMVDHPKFYLTTSRLYKPCIPTTSEKSIYMLTGLLKVPRMFGEKDLSLFWIRSRTYFLSLFSCLIRYFSNFAEALRWSLDWDTNYTLILITKPQYALCSRTGEVMLPFVVLPDESVANHESRDSEEVDCTRASIIIFPPSWRVI